MKRHATLIEVIVGLVLTTALITLLLVAYRQTATTLQKVEQARWPIEQHFALRQRLERVLTETTLVEEADPDYRGLFYTEALDHGPTGQSLVFTYNNGIDSDPKFSGEVLARIYVDDAHRLVLAAWPSPRRWKLDDPPCRTDILCDHVTSLDWGFFEPLSGQDSLPITEGHHRPPEGKSNTWNQDYQTLPALVSLRLCYTLEGDLETMRLTVPLHHAQKPITYTHVPKPRKAK